MLIQSSKDKIANLENKKKSLKAMLADDELGFTSDSDWEALVKHVEVHKYLVNQDIPWTISWSDAVFSWVENVYTPLMRVVDWWEIKKAFPGYSRGQLMFAVASHWHYMNEKDPEVMPEQAANDFAAHYGKGVGKWISRLKYSKSA